jgi:hypothetical protein
MKIDEINNSKLFWSEIEESKSETISGGHGNRSKSGGFNSFVRNTVIIFQTNIVNVIGSVIGGNLTINQGNFSGINQGNRGRR